MVLNVFEFEKYYFQRNDPGWYIEWPYVPNDDKFDLGLLGNRMGKSSPKSRIYSWISLLWTPEYNGDGSFQLEVPDTPENRNIRLSDQIMYDEDTSGTIMVVTSRQINDGKIVLNGVSLHCYILSKIYSNTTYTYWGQSDTTNTQDLIYNILSPFFLLNKLYQISPATAPTYPPLSGWDCVAIDSLNFSYARLPATLIEKTIKWESEKSAWDFIKSKILRAADIGFGSSFIDSKYVIETNYDPRYGTITYPTFNHEEHASKNGGWQGFYVKKPGLNNSVHFSKEIGNVINEIYTESETNFVNDATVYVGNNLEKLGYYFIANQAGLADYIKIYPQHMHFKRGSDPTVTRRSVFIDASSEEPQGYDNTTDTYSETPEHYIERIKNIADEEFSNNPFTKNWRFTVIDPENKVRLGDIIPIKSEYTGELVESRVTSITYKSQGGHTTRTLSVGTPIRIRRN